MTQTLIQRLRHVGQAAVRHKAVVFLALVVMATIAVEPLASEYQGHLLKKHASSSVTAQKLSPLQRRLQRRQKRVARLPVLKKPEQTQVQKKTTVVSRVAPPDEVEVPKVVAPLRTAAPVEPAVNDTFPAFGKAMYPVSRVPNWGAMYTPAEWNRTYAEMTQNDYVSIPTYSLKVLTTPMSVLLQDREGSIDEITAKLFYSTRYFGQYDLDAGEFTGNHVGIDMKLPEGTPVNAIGGGRVHDVRLNDIFGKHVIIEHHIDGQVYFSIYAHLGSTSVATGDTVTAGHVVGKVGMTGNTSGAHLHLQVDIGHGEETHVPYLVNGSISKSEAEKWTVHPISFIASHR